MTDIQLAAIRFETDDVDALLSDAAAALTAERLVVRGVLQSRGEVSGDCHCADMDLTSIGTGQVFRISQPLGTGSRGCRLDPGALAECSAHLEAELAAGADLLILNRFGRGESEGRGFRDLICAALARGVPVLTAVRPTYADAWAAFGGGAATDLPVHREAVCDWAHRAMAVRHAA